MAGAAAFEGHFQWRPGSTNDWRWQREEDGNDTGSVGELERRLGNEQRRWLILCSNLSKREQDKGEGTGE